jgi:hypothetical protein
MVKNYVEMNLNNYVKSAVQQGIRLLHTHLNIMDL